jgi:hypothetical protein
VAFSDADKSRTGFGYFQEICAYLLEKDAVKLNVVHIFLSD